MNQVHLFKGGLRMVDYADITTEEFDEFLKQILRSLAASELLLIEGVYELVSEEFNNEILDRWKRSKE